jgi:hypothetical protein
MWEQPGSFMHRHAIPESPCFFTSHCCRQSFLLWSQVWMARMCSALRSSVRETGVKDGICYDRSNGAAPFIPTRLKRGSSVDRQQN